MPQSHSPARLPIHPNPTKTCILEQLKELLLQNSVVVAGAASGFLSRMLPKPEANGCRALALTAWAISFLLEFDGRGIERIGRRVVI